MRPDPRHESSPAVRSRWHRTDWMALLSGALFVTAGILFITVPELGPAIMLPIVLGGLAFAGFVAIIARSIRR
ncbi:hypothetical protein [Planomonospora venezuelensis]|uniref:Uncharacterized membrane protein HdeD (DUF308 family) n=1 Tax=Planomonospora venezuelensis TaxID=1999 RepID=A0A841D2J2_PLAVE|nr:hypothetical protein [Planomonospora venezuelensis]MBB5964000.1 uncharacterized membrane protein HdeD (DUF308 family) [Planomonospora venezuelensis]GIN05064.1 hypothetical protein Pve01_67220 [Planomonospora venezuelensis]